MNQNSSTKNKKQKFDNESTIAVFLIALSAFLILAICIMIFRSCADESADTPIHTTDNQIENNPPEPVTVLDEIDSYYAVLVDLQTGWVVAQKNADIAFSPASMTKVMTLIVACEKLTSSDLTRQLPLTQDVIDYTTTGDYSDTGFSLPRESNGYSCIGDTYSVQDLLYGIGVASAADCTYMIVKEIAGTEEAFVQMMKAKARELGLSDTHFDNAVGFDSATNVTTAIDMAKIMAYAMQNDFIVDILKPRTQNYTITAHWEKDGEPATYNVSLKPSYKSRLDKYPEFSLTGVNLEACKTGFTNESFIVTSAVSKITGTRYILVLGDKDNGTQETTTVKLKNTMIDMETMFNTFVP